MVAVSQNGWVLNPARSSRKVPGADLSLTVVDGPGGDVLMYVAEQFNKRVEPLVGGVFDDWSYAYRPIGNSSFMSNHASATALDLNATRHPQGVRGTFTPSQVREIRAILAECSGVVRWGGDYAAPAKVDEMHFELNAPPAAVSAAATKLVNPPPHPIKPTVKRGSTGDDVKLVQRYLGVTPDGVFGPVTESAVKRYQQSQGFTPDGIVGPVTWRRIFTGLGSAGLVSSGRGSGSSPGA